MNRTIENRGHRDSQSPAYGTGSLQSVEYAPGIAAGVAGLATFLVLHAIWIVPIWSVAGLGLLVAVLGGAAVSWAYRHVEPHLAGGLVRRWVALVGGATVILSPSLVVAWTGDPYFTRIDGAPVATAETSLIAVRFVVEFLVVTTLTGALIGWWVTRTRRGTVAVTVAAFAFAIGPGHNLPFFHIFTAPAETQTGLLLTFVPIVVASTIFVGVDALLSRSA